MMGRRQFCKTNVFLIFAFALAAPLALTGCLNVGTLIGYLSLTVTIVLTVAGPFLPAPVLVIGALVKASLADLTAAIAQWQAAPATSKATFLQKVDLLLTDIVTNFQNVITSALQSLPSGSALLTLIENLAQDFLSTLTGLRTQLPAPPPQLMALKRPNGATVTPVKRDQDAYKKLVNSHLAAAGITDPNLVIQ
jgi:hypothetical protein